MQKEKLKPGKEFKDIVTRINEELTAMKLHVHPGISDADFESKTGVSRASLPGIEANTSTPDLATIYLWADGCRGSFTNLFRAPSTEYEDTTQPLHRKLELILKIEGEHHWLRNAIEDAFKKYETQRKVKPKPRVRGQPRPSIGRGEGQMQEASTIEKQKRQSSGR